MGAAEAVVIVVALLVNGFAIYALGTVAEDAIDQREGP